MPLGSPQILSSHTLVMAAKSERCLEIIHCKNLWESVIPFESANHNIVVVKYRFPDFHCIVSYD